ncbi:MAG: hypothetical protein HY710_03955 [Candidatus Latescibacteria bacterium]|nr:hypothetical protein [Candidatus Latescibacterota bacterium]
MSATIYVKSSHEESDIVHLVKSAIEAEIARYELALEMASNRLRPFEQKYQVTSEYFIAHLTAEDLDGHDEEYVRWAGEYHLKQRLEQKLQQLREIEYGHPDVLQSPERGD